MTYDWWKGINQIHQHTDTDSYNNQRGAVLRKMEENWLFRHRRQEKYFDHDAKMEWGDHGIPAC